MTLPSSLVEYPLIASSASSRAMASSWVIMSRGEMTDTFPRTLSSTTNPLPVTRPMYSITVRMSTSLKSMDTLPAFSFSCSWFKVIVSASSASSA